MAQTGRVGGRQSLENKRQHGPIHAKPPETPNAHDQSSAANASVQSGSSNTNRKKRGNL